MISAPEPGMQEKSAKRVYLHRPSSSIVVPLTHEEAGLNQPPLGWPDLGDQPENGAAPSPASARQSNGRRDTASEIFIALAQDRSSATITFGEIIQALGQRGYGLLILLFSLPNLLPIPVPGWGAILAVPVGAFGLQLAIGWHRPWLPRRILERTIKRETLAALVTRAAPFLTRLERAAKPRLFDLTTWTAERVLGAVIVCLSLLLSLPVPFTNGIVALPLVFLSLGLLERDGVIILVGYVLSVTLGGLVVTLGWIVVKVATLFVLRELGL
jgi:hypothetical protein